MLTKSDHSRRWHILAVLVLAEFVVELDTTIVNVALPDIARAYDADTRTLQWVVDAYTLVFGGLLLVAGALGDRLGRRPVLVAGLWIFLGGAMVASVAPAEAWLVVGRAVMGLGAACILPTTLSILTEVFHGEERVRAFSIWSAMAGLSFALGPTVGGALVEAHGWRAVFLVNLPIAVAAIVACIGVLPRRGRVSSAPPDVVGGVLSVASLGLLLYAIIEAPHDGWRSSSTVAELIAAGMLFACFLVWERRAAAPMLDLALFRSRTFTAASLAIGLTFLAISGALFVLTQYLQLVLGYEPLAAGVRLLPVAAAVAVAAPLSVPVARVLGTNVSVALGLGLTTVSGGIMTSITTQTGYGRVALGLVVAGAGMGLALTPATTAMLTAVSRARVGSSAALNNAALIIGSALGVAVLGSILASSYTTHLAPLLAGMPPQVVHQVGDSLAAALHVAGQLDNQLGVRLISRARAAFVAAVSDTFVVAVATAAAGTVVAAVMLPRRLPAEDSARETSDDQMS